MNKVLYQKIREQLGDMYIADAHSHIAPEAALKYGNYDFTCLLDYSATDLVSAGLPRDLFVSMAAADSRYRLDYGYDFALDTRSDMEKWEPMKPYWPMVKNIGSGFLVQKALKLLCDVDDLTDETIPVIREKLAGWQKESSYQDMLVDKAKIDRIYGVTMDINENPSTDIIKQQLYIDIYTGIQNRRQVYSLEKLSGVSIYSLDSYVTALDTFLEKQVKEGIVAFKWHFFPYMRPFTFELADRGEAERALDKILLLPMRGATGSAVSVGFEEMKPLHNYLQHHVIHKAIELGVPIQIHTGTFGGTLGGHLEYSNPIHLTDVFKRYPQVNFNILHSGFPYQREAGELARIFPNVFVNAAWMDTLSPLAFKESIKEWITYIPINKIFAFGSDQFGAFLTYASAENARDLVAEVLTELIEENRLTEKDAMFAAKRIMHDNVIEYYEKK